MVDSASQKSGSVAVDVAGNLTGEGTLSFGASTAADYRISGDNTQFKGEIQLADTEGKTLFADGMAMGGSDTTVHLNGATFSVENGTQAVRAQLLVTETSVLAAEDDITFSSAPTGKGTLEMTGDHTATFSGAVDTFEGTFSTAEEATIALGGKDAAALNRNITATLAGAGTYCMDYKDSVVLSGVVGGTANLHQSGSGKLILIAEKNTTTGTLTVDKGTEVQLGDAATPGVWAGSELAGEGTFILTNGMLSGLTTKAKDAKLVVKTTKKEVSTFARRSGADEGTIVSLSGSAAQLLDSIELAEGSTLVVGADLIVGGAGNTTLDMAFTAVNFGKVLRETHAMIQGGDLTIASTEGVSLKLNKADLLEALGDIGKGDLYLQITDGALYTAKGLNINDVIAPDLLGMGIRAHLTDVSKAGGYVIINGDVTDVYFTDNQVNCSNTTADKVEVKDGVLGIYAATVVNTNDTLTVKADTTINNLNGKEGGNVIIADGATVVLNNQQMPTGVPKYDPMGAMNKLAGSLTGQTDTSTGQTGTSITVKGKGGSLTVGGKLTADTLIVESGDLYANGSANVKNLTVAKFATMTVANGMELKAGSIQGVLKADGAGTSLSTTGQVSVGGTLSNMDLTIESGSMEFLNDAEGKGTATLNSLQVKKSATLEGNGTTVSVGASQPNIIAGTLSGSGSLEMTGSTESKLLFDNATGSTGWSVTTQGDIEIDSTEGKALQLGQVSLGSQKTLTLRFNSDKHQDNNFNVFDLLNLDFSTAEDGTTTAITLISTGSAQLEDGRYVLGTIKNGISFGGLSFQATEVELTQLPLQLVGDAFSRIDVEQSTLVFADKALILNLVKSDANAFEMPNAEKNAATGAELLWRAVTPEDGDLKDVYNAVNYMIADGDNQAAQEAMAAVAGSSTASLGMALAGDVERQLRAIRNRTTTMGVNQCVMNENMPYFNAWVNAEGNHSELDQDGLASGYVLDSWGGTVGFDVDVNPNLTLGLAVTAMYGDLTVDGPDTLEGDMDTCYVTAFARYSKHAWTHTFIGTIGKMDGSYERTVNYGRNSYTAEGDTDGTTFGLMYEVSRTYAFSEDSDACWQPVFNIAYRHTTVKGYTETATDAALDVDDQTLDTVTLSAGARMQAVVGENLFERTSVLELRALAKLDVGDRASEADVALINGTGRGTVESAELGAFGVELGAGLSIPVGNVNDGTIFFDVSAELRSGYSNVNGTVGYRINF
ncbi:MAG: autotransporter outer membrane beta-barrel domain-containing protein [Akkermansia sp.]|nr:autotransporter outer membrane beta-barrel domain-containing protein [Akkermansia sp.]